MVFKIWAESTVGKRSLLQQGPETQICFKGEDSILLEKQTISQPQP